MLVRVERTTKYMLPVRDAHLPKSPPLAFLEDKTRLAIRLLET